MDLAPLSLNACRSFPRLEAWTTARPPIAAAPPQRVCTRGVPHTTGGKCRPPHRRPSRRSAPPHWPAAVCAPEMMFTRDISFAIYNATACTTTGWSGPGWLAPTSCVHSLTNRLACGLINFKAPVTASNLSKWTGQPMDRKQRQLLVYLRAISSTSPGSASHKNVSET